MLGSDADGDVARWTLGRRPLAAPRVRLICLPFAGGSAAVFRDWRDHLPADIEACPIQLPGRQNRLAEPLLDDVVLVAETLVRVLRPLLEVPIALFGHSLGAVLAFEVARQMRVQAGLTPIRLIVSGSRAPEQAAPETKLSQLPDEQLIERARVPPEMQSNRDMLDLVLPALRADFAMSERYRYRPGVPLACPITALGGAADKDVPPTALEAWRSYTIGPFAMRVLPGGHLYLLDAVPLVTSVVGESLGRR